MDQIIVKRPANVSSQEALMHLALEYPDSEVLSFRRVKSAGLDGDYFVATLRVAVMADEADDVVLDDSDVVLEGEQHEEEEEEQMEDQDDKLDKIIDMLSDLIKKDEEVHKMVDKPEPSLIQQRPPIKNPVPMQPMANERLAKLRKRAKGQCECWEGYKRVPGTKPCAPGSCEKCDKARKNSMVVVERDADVKQSRARLELLKEFGKEYKIAHLSKTGKIYSATLVKKAEGEDSYLDQMWEDEAVRRSEPFDEHGNHDEEPHCRWCGDQGCEECDPGLEKTQGEPSDMEAVRRYSPKFENFSSEKKAEWDGLRGEQEAEINDIFDNQARLEREKRRKEEVRQRALEAIDRGADYDELDEIFGDEDPLEFF